VPEGSSYFPGLFCFDYKAIILALLCKYNIKLQSNYFQIFLDNFLNFFILRLIERLYQFIEYKGLSAYAFERSCEFSNGYLKKQLKGGGSVGSDVLEKIHQVYPELSLIWLITGRGTMLFSEDANQETQDSGEAYHSDSEEMVHLLKDKIKLLESSVADKEKIISLMESREKKEDKAKDSSLGTSKNKK